MINLFIDDNDSEMERLIKKFNFSNEPLTHGEKIVILDFYVKDIKKYAATNESGALMIQNVVEKVLKR